MTNLSRFLSFTAILLSLTPLSGVFSMLRAFDWIDADSLICLGASDASSKHTIEADLPSHAATNMTADFHMTPNHSSKLQEQSHSVPRIYMANKDHFDAPYPLLLSWILSMILGLSIPILALMYDAYLRITQNSRKTRRRQRIEKALRPCRRRITTKAQEKESCAICLASYAIGETIVCSSKTSECRHCFHEACMVTWLVKQQKQSSKGQQRCHTPDEQCPCCRQTFVSIPSR